MFEKEAEDYAGKGGLPKEKYYYGLKAKSFKDGAEFGYNKANEWHYVKDGDLPRQYEHTCYSIEVLSNNKKWVHYRFDYGEWFCGNKEVKVLAWKEIILPELKENE